MSPLNSRASTWRKALVAHLRLGDIYRHTEDKVSYLLILSQHPSYRGVGCLEVTDDGKFIGDLLWTSYDAWVEVLEWQ